MEGRNGFLVLVYQASRCIADQRPLSSTPGCRTHLLPKKHKPGGVKTTHIMATQDPPVACGEAATWTTHTAAIARLPSVTTNRQGIHSQPLQGSSNALCCYLQQHVLPCRVLRIKKNTSTTPETCPKTRNQATYKPPWQHMHPLTSGVCATALAPLAQLHLLRILGPTAPLEDTRR